MNLTGYTMEGAERKGLRERLEYNLFPREHVEIDRGPEAIPSEDLYRDDAGTWQPLNASRV